MIEIKRPHLNTAPLLRAQAVAKQALRCDAVSSPDVFDPHTACNCTGVEAITGAFPRPLAPLVVPALVGRDAAFATPVPVPEIKKLIEERLPDLFKVYKDLHQNPELSGMEVRTRGIVAERMKQLGYEVTENFGKYADGTECQSVVAICKNGEGPTLLVRGDMDALPIIEKTDVPYRSTKKVRRPDGSEVGVMHACGHDVHTTNLMGFADIMMQLKDRWSGTLMLVAQPAEEAISGANAMMSSGLYEKFGTPDAAIGMHVLGSLTPNLISTRVGPMMASIDALSVTLHGRGAHGSQPQASIDPVVMLGNFIVQTNHIVSRNVTPGTPSLITVGQVQAGTASNIIPDTALAKLTVRSFDDKVQTTLLNGVSRVALGVATTAGAPKNPDIEKMQDTYPAVINDAKLTNRLVGIWQETLAGENIGVREHPTTMGGEDFSRYAKQDRSVPTTFFWVGASTQAELDRRQQAGLPPPVTHTADFLPTAEDTLRTGMLAFTTVATSFLQKKE